MGKNKKYGLQEFSFFFYFCVESMNTNDIRERIRARFPTPPPIDINFEEEEANATGFLASALRFYGQAPENWVEVIGFTEEEFDALSQLLLQEPHIQPGPPAAIRNTEDQLFLTLAYLRAGTLDLIRFLLGNRVRSDSTIFNTIKRFIHRVLPLARQQLLIFRNEDSGTIPHVSAAVDCTKIPCRRPTTSFRVGTTYFSGHRHMYCFNVNVVVNVRSGTAIDVSRFYPGSVHDLTVFRDHVRTFEQKLGGSAIVADAGFVGARDRHNIVIADRHAPEPIRLCRLIVENFFGRLKTICRIFRLPWPIGAASFDEFFQFACCVTNFHILHNPLRQADVDMNERYIRALTAEAVRRQETHREFQRAYSQRRRTRIRRSIEEAHRAAEEETPDDPPV